jgi:hypothetical protein
MASHYNQQIIEEFRAHSGRLGGPWEGWPLILVHHVGARSGINRVTPVGCFPQDDGRFVTPGRPERWDAGRRAFRIQPVPTARRRCRHRHVPAPTGRHSL